MDLERPSGVPIHCVEDGAPELRALPEALTRLLPADTIPVVARPVVPSRTRLRWTLALSAPPRLETFRSVAHRQRPRIGANGVCKWWYE